jgi:hypothetical protein
MTRQVSINELISMVNNVENFEVVDYQGDYILVDDVKGIVKIKDERLRRSSASYAKEALRVNQRLSSYP